ncbi:MAG: recombinase family protein [Rectinemataceae bacterium]|nr:recombinase family protein [Rectinemataceae bacterium]
MKYIIYQRVSTEEQADTRNGLNAQADSCKVYISRSAGELLSVHSDEGISGAASLDKRPGLLAAIGELGKGDVLIVAKRDRLGRDPLVLAMIEASVNRKGARVISASGEGTENDDPSSILMRRMVDAFSEYERLIIKARTKAALQAKKARNERVGHIPFGYRLAADGKHLEPCEYERAILEEIGALKASGLSLRGIAQELNRKGLTNRGNEWKHVAVSRVAA